MKNWLTRVMAGRNGVDELNRSLTVFALICLLLSVFLKNSLSVIFWLLAILSLIWNYFRMFSRNIAKRQTENNRYLTVHYSFTRQWTGLKQRLKQKRYYRFYKCPSCGVTTRVPKGKGKIRITCPKCGESFIRKS